MRWIVTVMEICFGLLLLVMIVWPLAVVVSAVLGKTKWLRPREETAEQRARREEMQKRLDLESKALGVGMAGISWGLPIGSIVSALTKRRATQNERNPNTPAPPAGGDEATCVDSQESAPRRG